MNQMEYKGYTAVIEYDDDDECLVGHVIGISDRLAFDGESIPEIKRNFRNVLDNYLALCAKTGKQPETPKSGKLSLRLPVELHAFVARQAEATGESVNNIIVEAVQSFRHGRNKTTSQWTVGTQKHRTVTRQKTRSGNAATNDRSSVKK